MSGIQSTTENINIASIIDQIKASQQKVLQAFENHNSLVNKSLELLQQLKTETKIEVVKVRDPLEELKIVRDEFNKNFLTDTDLEPIKTSSKKWLETTYENNPKNICRSIGWIESITFKNCQNIKSVTLHFQLFKDEITFNYSLDENSKECILYFGSPDSSRIIDDTIHTSMFPINILPYQPIYFTCEKIDETKPCYATMMYGYYDFLVPSKLINRIIFTIQDRKLFIRSGACYPYENENIHLLNHDNKIGGDEYLRKIIDILWLYGTDKISTSFKEIFLKLFKTILDSNNQGNINQLKQRILTVRDIRWLLLELEKYPHHFQFYERDLEIMKENGASRDNIYLVKKFLKKDGDYEELYSEEEGGGIHLKYHMTGGHLNGDYKKFYKDGKIELETKYTNGVQDNSWKVWYDNGQQFVEGKITGENIQWYKNGNIMNKYYRINDKKDGEYKEWHEDGSLCIVANHKDDKVYGDYEIYHPNGKLYKKMFCLDGDIKNNIFKLHGKYTEYRKDGTLEIECEYKEGKLEGEYVRYIKGKLNIIAHYKEGKLHGKYTEYKKDGTYLKECSYTEGKLINLRTYNTSGHLELKKSLIRYDTYELSRYYECDGKIHDKVIMIGDKWNGEYKSWWNNGNKCIETTYKDDKIHGEYTYWNEDGTLKEKSVYEDGVKV